MSVSPQLVAVAVHWHDEQGLALLTEHWPADPRFELLVVDNGSEAGLSMYAKGRANIRILEPGRNLGFAGAVNYGASATDASLLLILNTDAHPISGAVETLVEAIVGRPDIAGLAPRLLGEDGREQAAWQLRSLPTLPTLIGYCCFIEPRAREEPAAGAVVEQPAACALLLRRSVFERVGAMDEQFWPAWFEDVDLGRRLVDAGESIRYLPDACFHHGLGASIPRLGYGPFLLSYYRNLVRYARKHHGRGGAAVLSLVLAASSLARIVLLPLRRPRRAESRREALDALGRLALSAASGWRNR